MFSGDEKEEDDDGMLERREEENDGMLASIALECLITEDSATTTQIPETVKRKRGRKKKSEIPVQVEAVETVEKPKRKRLNMVEPGGPFYCDNPGCGKFYCRRRELNRHKRYGCGTPPQFKCEYCPLRTAQRYNLVTHMRMKHGDQCFMGHEAI